MATREQIGQKILDRLSERVKEYKPCVVCGEHDWQLQDTFTVLPLVDDPSTMQQPQFAPTLPSVSMICQNCGNTHFLNLLVLGFDLKSLKSDGD